MNLFFYAPRNRPLNTVMFVSAILGAAFFTQASLNGDKVLPFLWFLLAMVLTSHGAEVLPREKYLMAGLFRILGLLFAILCIISSATYVLSHW